MIIGLGIDVTELDRISRSWERFGVRFASKILTPCELKMLPQKSDNAAVNYLAARFAAKEAAVKALGTGFSNGVTCKDIEVRNLESGKPFLTLYGAALEICRELGVAHTHVSLTHGRDVAAAVVVLEGSIHHSQE